MKTKLKTYTISYRKDTKFCSTLFNVSISESKNSQSEDTKLTLNLLLILPSSRNCWDLD
jgi:hypothetical protein